MVETRSAIFSMDHLNHDLNTSLLDKADTDVQFHTIDQHNSMTVESPRVSSTPPSTPGLESNQGKENKDDEDEDEEEDDYADYMDYAYDEYINGDCSEPDEDYFFKDFATNTDSNTATTTRPKSKRYSRRRRSQKAMSRFDLQSFARQLHANRLSVLQTRQSRMILTEEDEQELDKLLARKVTQSPPPPPVPALPPVPAFSPLTTTPAEQDTTSTTNGGSKAIVIEPSSGLAGPIPYGSISSDTLKKPSLLLQKLNDQHPSIRSKNTAFIEMAPLSPSLSDHSSFTSPRRAPTPPSESSSPFSSLSASLPSSSTSTSTTEKERKPSSHVPTTATTTVTLGPAPTTFTIKKKPSWIGNRKQLKTRDQPKLAAPLSPLSSLTATTQLRQTISLDSLRDSPRPSKESWKLTKASTTKPAIASSTTNTTKASERISLSSATTPSLATSSSTTLEDNKKPKSRLFGSLRQASRSSRAAGEGAIRGLMRNLSTVGRQQQQQPLDQAATSSSTLSRAAKAAIQHGVSNDSNNKNKKSRTVSASAALSRTPNDLTDGMDDSTVQVTHTATSTKGGVRLLSNLLAKARSRRSSPVIKRTAAAHVPLNDTTTDAIKERNKVVRRTIIYVQPDALDFMKDGHLPPIPAPKSKHFENGLNDDDDDDDQDMTQGRTSKDITMEDASSPTVEYATATKLTRQTSRRKRLVEEPSSSVVGQEQTQNQHATTTMADHKKWRLESVSEFNVAGNNNNGYHHGHPNDDDLYDYYRTNDMDDGDDHAQLEGLELREMSDGSVVWGIVKKQGNRKSFFASKALEDSMMEHQHQMEILQQEQEAEKEHDQIEKSVLALMGLEPDSLDHFTARLSDTSSTSSGAGAGQLLRMSGDSSGSEGKKASLPPPPIPKRSPRRKCQDNGSGSKDGSAKLQRGLSVEEQLDEMMLSLKQSQL